MFISHDQAELPGRATSVVDSAEIGEPKGYFQTVESVFNAKNSMSTALQANLEGPGADPNPWVGSHFFLFLKMQNFIG